jgi:hypothetical protein
MQSLPSSPGLYVVSLSNEHPISVNADRAHAGQCIFVTKANCKFGRAQNLARRYRDYVKTFGAEYVTFEVVAFVDNPVVLESAVASRLTEHRMKGASGRMNEWLAGITLPALKKLISEEVTKHAAAPLSATSDPPRARSSPADTPPSRLLITGADPAGSPAEVVASATYLQGAGMPVAVLRDLHHFSQRTETFASTIRYFGGKRNLGRANQLYAARLLFVERGHREGRAGFEALASKALRVYPHLSNG